MKKLLAVLALALIATPAFATIVNTPHDLATGNAELCVYCHTPHNASTAMAPLWNRNVVAPTANYTGTGTFSQNGAINYTGTDVSLCLSCHDGVVLMNAVLNAPSANGPTIATAVNNAKNLGTILSNDHPVGFNYSAADANDAEIIQPSGNFGSTGFPGVLAGGQMQCSTCHDVHNNDRGAFLVMNNASSNLCLACHQK